MTNKLNILIVDDMQEWLNFHFDLLHKILPENSFTLHSETSAKAAFNKFLKTSDFSYDLIISDLEMELISGEPNAGNWLIKNILKKTSSIKNKIIIISGSYDIKDIAQKLDVEFIPKDLLVKNPMLLKYKLNELQIA